jgi:hypothetical protein
MHSFGILNNQDYATGLVDATPSSAAMADAQ